MENFEIGRATIQYDEQGNVTLAYFEPTMKIGLDANIATELKKLVDSTQIETVKENADTVMASWFAKMNQIELSDREEYDIVSKVVKCEKWDSGKVKMCVIEYTFQKLQ